MKALDVVKECMRRRNYTQLKLAKDVGYSSNTGISEILRRDDIKSRHFIKLLNALGYELVVRDKYSKEEIVVTGE